MTIQPKNVPQKMKNGIRKRGSNWEFIVDLGRDEHGRRKQQWYYGYPTKAIAKEAQTSILAKRDAKTYISPTKLTLSAYMTRWLEGQRSRLRPATSDSYGRNIRAHIIPALGAIPVQNLTPAALNAFYADRQAGKTRRALAPRTTRYCHMILRKALKDAVRQGLTTRNVADAADPPRVGTSTEMKVWTALELRTFLSQVQDDRLYGAWMLAASTGMRRGEVLGLRWRDVDLETGRLSVTQTLITVKFQVQFGTPKTEKGRRSVALDLGTVTVLREHKRRQREEMMAFGRANWPNHDLVFTGAAGAPLHPQQFTRWFDQRVRAAGLPRIRLHDLRHTHATLALQVGIHPKVVSERLGHANVTITLNTYSHSIPAMQEDAAAKVAAFVFGT